MSHVPGPIIRRLAAGALLVWCVAQPALTQPAPGDAEGAIFERQQLMIQLGKDAETLGAIAAGAAPAARLKDTTRAIADAARDSVEAFAEPAPGGRSKPEVWSDHPDFMKRMNDFARNAEAMAKAGETGNVTAVTGLMVDAMPCKPCHDLYRAPKTS